MKPDCVKETFRGRRSAGLFLAGVVDVLELQSVVQLVQYEAPSTTKCTEDTWRKHGASEIRHRARSGAFNGCWNLELKINQTLMYFWTV